MSRHPDDAAHGYCARCHWWAGDPQLGPAHLAAPCPERKEPAVTGQCPCGEVHELPAPVRAVTAGLSPLVRVFVPDAGCWLVPRIYIAVHGLKAGELPDLAERYGFAPHPHPGQR